MDCCVNASRCFHSALPLQICVEHTHSLTINDKSSGKRAKANEEMKSTLDSNHILYPSIDVYKFKLKLSRTSFLKMNREKISKQNEMH